MDILRSKKGFICDMDGVIYHGERLLPGVYGKVGAGVGVELDGFEFHSSRDAFERGRARDADLAAVGWLMVHFTAETASDIGKRTAAR